MKRPFRGFEVVGLAAAVAAGAACAPSNSVKSGAPVLIEVSIVEGGGATVTSIPAGEPACAAGTVGGGGCDPSTAGTCFLATKHNWCRCAANMAPAAPTSGPSCTDGGTDAGAGGAGGIGAGGIGGAGLGGMGDASTTDASADAATDAATPAPGSWNCDPFQPTAGVLFVFDRLLDSTPLDPGDGGAPVAAAMVSSVSAGSLVPMNVTSNADYTSNGSPNTFFFKTVFGEFRADGPNLLVGGVPALPGNAAVTVTLDGSKVHAKDGKTPFTDAGNFGGGALTFSTTGLSATVTPPAPPPLPADAGACATPNTDVALDAPATITFNSPVDPTALMAAVTAIVVSTGASIPVTLSSMDHLNVTVAPTDKWPANADIIIRVAASATDLAGDVLADQVMSEPFHAGAL
jgi:hypothetical protein